MKRAGQNPCPSRSPCGRYLCDKEAGHFAAHSTRTGEGPRRVQWYGEVAGAPDGVRTRKRR